MLARVAFAALLGFLGSPSRTGGLAAVSTATFAVAPANPVNTQWNGLGANYMGFAEMSEATRDGMTSALRTIEYQRVVDSGVLTVSTWLGNDWACTSYPTGCYTFASAHWVAFEAWLQAMKDRGVKVIVKIGWTFPGDICGPYTTVCVPSAGDLVTFKHFASDVLNRLLNVQGYTNVVGLAAFTEPNFPNAGIPGGVDPKDYYITMVTAVRAQIAADDGSRTPILPRVQIIGPDEETQSTDDWPVYMQANAPTQFDAWSSHTYCVNPTFGPLSLTVSNCPDYATLIAQVSPWVTHAGVKGFTFSELNTLGSTGNLNPYRNTADNGLVVARFVDGEAQSGARGVFGWMMQDQHWPDFTTVGYQQEYGLWGRWLGQTTDVPPSWYVMSLISNLTGGGGATTVAKTYGGTSTLHGSAYSIPNGGYHCSDSNGCLTLEVINEGSTPQTISWRYDTALSPSRTFYRYVYNAEGSPRARPDKPAYLLPWDATYSGVTSTISGGVVPGHSVVFYSTINLAATTPALNLSTTATVAASATTSGTASVLADGNTTHASGAANAWVAGSTGLQTATLTWSTSQTFNRIELDMIGTVYPKFFADYATNAEPTEASQYTLQYWNGSAYVDFVPAISVTANTQSHRTHTFAAVTTTRLQLGVPNAPSAGFTEVGTFYDASTPDTAIGFYDCNDGTGAGGTIVEYTIANTSYTFVAGDTIEYDVELIDRTDYVVSQTKAGIGGLDVVIDTGCSSTELRAVAGYQDQNAVSGATTADLTSYAYATWLHRVMTVPACAIGHVAQSFAISQQRNDRTCTSVNSPCTSGTYYPSCGTAFYDNITVKHANGSTALTVYADGSTERVVAAHYSSVQRPMIWVGPKS